MDRSLFGGPLSEEASMDRRTSLDRRSSLSRMPPESGGLSGLEALSVSMPLWTGGPLSHLANLDKRPSVKKSLGQETHSVRRGSLGLYDRRPSKSHLEAL